MLSAKIKNRIFIIQIVIALVMSTIAVRLGYLQISSHDALLELASELWQRSFPIEPSRGYINDRNGEALAINLPVMSIAVIPYQVKEKETTAKELAKILNADGDDIYKKISKRESIIRLQPYGRKITNSQAEAIVKARLDGVYLIQDTARYYPYNQLLAPTIGFVGIDNQGLAGIENYYDEYLRGVRGNLSYYMDAKGGIFPNYSSTLQAPVDGLSINLTIDLNIQSIIEREAENAYQMYNPDSLMIIATNPQTGEILGMTNRPTYNPNQYQDYSQEVYNRNLPLWMAIEPGSTFKVFSFAAALNENKIDMYNDYYYDRGFEIVGGAVIKSWKKGGHGLQTFLEVLQNSSNPGFVEIARRLGKDNLYNYIKNFGFSEKTGIDITGEAKGLMFPYDRYNELEQATTAFGQGLTVTPLQLINAFSSLINGGKLMQPYIVKTISTNHSRDIILKKTPTVIRQVISEEASKKMKDALEHVVALGSGTRAYIDGYRVGGKTGTAQIAENGVYLDSEYNLNFIGAAPINDPQIAVYVNLEKPKNNVQYGGTVAAPIAKSILRDSLSYLKIKKQSYQLDRKYTWMDIRTHVVPNYIGLDRNKVSSRIFKFVNFGEGTKVIDQLPREGERIEEGATIVLMLGA